MVEALDQSQISSEFGEKHPGQVDILWFDVDLEQFALLQGWLTGVECGDKGSGSSRFTIKVRPLQSPTNSCKLLYSPFLIKVRPLQIHSCRNCYTFTLYFVLAIKVRPLLSYWGISPLDAILPCLDPSPWCLTARFLVLDLFSQQSLRHGLMCSSQKTCRYWFVSTTSKTTIFFIGLYSP